MIWVSEVGIRECALEWDPNMSKHNLAEKKVMRWIRKVGVEDLASKCVPYSTDAHPGGGRDVSGFSGDCSYR